MKDLASLFVGLTRIREKYPGDNVLVVINDFVDLFGYHGPKWRQKNALLTVLRECNIEYRLIKERLSNFSEDDITICIEDEDFRVLSPRRISIGKTKVEKLILVRPEDLQLLTLCGRRKPSMCLIKILRDVINENRGMADDFSQRAQVLVHGDKDDPLRRIMDRCGLPTGSMYIPMIIQEEDIKWPIKEK